jgi:hypothetical protein
MKAYYKLIMVLFCIVITSCNKRETTNPFADPIQKEGVEWLLTEQVLGYWDMYYKYPSNYLEMRDSDAWYFHYSPQYLQTDSLLMDNLSKIQFIELDKSLAIILNNDTLAKVTIDCICNSNEHFPLGARAFDSLGIMDEDFVMEQLHDDLMKIIHPKIEQKMNGLGYYRHPVSKQAGEQKLPEGLLIEYKYEPQGGSIRLIDECKDYSYLLYTDYQNVLKSILERYCAEKKIIKLLMPIDIYLPND